MCILWTQVFSTFAGNEILVDVNAFASCRWIIHKIIARDTGLWSRQHGKKRKVVPVSNRKEARVGFPEALLIILGHERPRIGLFNGLFLDTYS